MSLSKKLETEQIELISSWLDSGLTLGEVQRKLDQELGIKVSFMETRFLISDLGLEVKSAVTEESKDKDGETSELDSDDGVLELEPDVNGSGQVTVTIDEVTPANALIGGSVTFSDGVSAKWMLDQMGQLGLDPSTPGYHPSEADLDQFQRELRRVFEQRGAL